MAWQWDSKTNRWVQVPDTPPTTQPNQGWDPQRGNYGPTTTTTAPPARTTPTTTSPANPSTPSNSSSVAPRNRITSNVPYRPSTPRAPLAYDPKIARIAAKNDPKNWLHKAVQDALNSGDNELLSRLLGENAGGGGSGPSESQLRQQRIGSAKKMNRQTSAMAKKYLGEQSQQANQAIDAATAELLANMGQPTAYSNVPFVNVPPALQGLQQNLLAYGGTGQDAASQQAQDQQANDMYAALANRSAQQLGAAETAYFDALRRSALGAQAAGRQGVAQNVSDLQNQVLMANIQALLNASQ